MTRLYTDEAELYDIAFGWDVGGEVDWLLERLGAQCRSVIEPGCGSGRMLEALASRGLEVVGIDSSPAMVALARERLGGRGVVHLADMTEFDLGRTFGGAVSPISTLLHLTPAQLRRHLDAMARQLEPRARYLVQVGVVDPAQAGPFADSHWEESRGETSLRIDCVDEELDVAGGRSRQRLRIEVLEGPRAGEVVEDVLDMTAWTPAGWSSAIEASRFTQVATYDGASRDRPCVAPMATGGLLWHELERDLTP